MVRSFTLLLLVRCTFTLNIVKIICQINQGKFPPKFPFFVQGLMSEHNTSYEFVKTISLKKGEKKEIIAALNE